MLTVGHSSMQQPSIYPRSITQRIDTDPRDHVITQGQMYPQAFNQPAMFGGEDNRVDPRPLYSPYTVVGGGTNPQLSSSKIVYPGVTQYPSAIPQQQIMGISSNYSPYMVPGTGTTPQLSNNLDNYLRMMQNPSGMPQQQIMGMSSNATRGRMVPTNRGASYIGATDNTSSRSVSFQSSSISNPNNVNLYSHSTNPAAVPVCESSRLITQFVPSLPLSSVSILMVNVL